MTYKSSRFFVPSSLPAAQAMKKHVGRARKMAMSEQQQPLTYQHILDRITFLVTTKQISAQTGANRATALRAFLRANKLSVDDVVGQEMRGEYSNSVELYLDELRAAGKTQRNITNSRSALSPVRRMVLDDDTIRALDADKPTPFMLRLQELVSGYGPTLVAKQARVPKDMMFGWLRGKVPRASSAKYVHRVENFFGIGRGELWRISGARGAEATAAERVEKRKVEYRETLGERNALRYWLVADAQSPLRKQWRDLMVYKTALVPALERSAGGQWRISPLPLERTTDLNWYNFLDGREVASAKAGWAKVASYLGWLQLPVEQGGAGLPPEGMHTLAWLVVPEYLEGFLHWRRERSQGMHTTWAPDFLGGLMCLVRPEVGYLPQNPQLQSTLPERYQAVSWQQLCHKQFNHCRKLKRSLLGQVRVFRDPFDPLSGVLELPEPLEAVVDMVKRMRADRPVGNPEMEAIWARDIALVKLHASNPLRLRHFAHMTWRADNTGNLYQKADGSWHVRFKKVTFKNARGGAQVIDYDAEVQPRVWTDLERYLNKFRNQLLRHPTDLVFLCSARNAEGKSKSHRPWAELSRRVFVLTQRYLWQSAGIGSHGFRHLIGSSIIKAAPGEYLTVARVLNDTEATVKRSYARFSSSDGNRRMGEVLGKSFSRL